MAGSEGRRGTDFVTIGLLALMVATVAAVSVFITLYLTNDDDDDKPARDAAPVATAAPDTQDDEAIVTRRYTRQGYFCVDWVIRGVEQTGCWGSQFNCYDDARVGGTLPGGCR